jgi:predicted nucleic acid-binding protein
MKVFLDTHVLVSAVATSGLSSEVFREVLINHQLVVSQALIAEIKNFLERKIGVSDNLLSDYLKVLNQGTVIRENSIFLIAYNKKVDLFVTYDPELIKIETICSMRILSPKAFWEIGEDLP